MVRFYDETNIKHTLLRTGKEQECRIEKVTQEKCGPLQMMLHHQEEQIQKDKVVYISAVIRGQLLKKLGHMFFIMLLSFH